MGKGTALGPLQSVTLTLDQVRAGSVPRLPPLDRAAQGYLVRSLPAPMQAALAAESGGMIAVVRARRARRHVDLDMGFDAWHTTIEQSTRERLRAYETRIAAISGGMLAIRRCDTAPAVGAFLDHAARIDTRGHHARLGASLPDDPAFQRQMAALAAHGALRAWRLAVAGEPAAYLYGEVINGIVINRYEGCDPAFAELRPSLVLQWHAIRALFAEAGLRHVDFHDRESEAARCFATGAVPCVDLALLRASFADRVSAAVTNGLGRVGAAAGRTGRGRRGAAEPAA